VAIFANLWLEESIEVQSVARHQGPEGLVGLVGLVAGMVNAPWFSGGESGDHNEFSIKNHLK